MVLPSRPPRLRIGLLVPGPRPGVGHVVRDAPVDGEQQPHGELCHRDRVLARNIGDEYRPPGGGLAIDRVGAGACPDHQAERRRPSRRHPLRPWSSEPPAPRRRRPPPASSAVVELRLIVDIVARRGQRLDPGLLESVGDENLHLTEASAHASGLSGRIRLSGHVRLSRRLIASEYTKRKVGDPVNGCHAVFGEIRALRSDHGSARRWRERSSASGDRSIVLPTFAQLADPDQHPAGDPRAWLAQSTPTPRTPPTSFGSTGSTTPRGPATTEVPGYLELPGELTGVDARILVVLGNRFPMIRAHKVLAAYACLAPADRHRRLRPHPRPGDLAVDRQLREGRRGHQPDHGLPRSCGPSRGHEPRAVRMARSLDRRSRRRHPDLRHRVQRQGDLRRLQRTGQGSRPTSSSTSSPSSETTSATSELPVPPSSGSSQTPAASDSPPSWPPRDRPAPSAPGTT